MKKQKVEKLNKSGKLYRGMRLTIRPRSLDFLKYPTRIGKSLFYWDFYGFDGQTIASAQRVEKELRMVDGSGDSGVDQTGQTDGSGHIEVKGV